MGVGLTAKFFDKIVHVMARRCQVSYSVHGQVLYDHNVTHNFIGRFKIMFRSVFCNFGNQSVSIILLMSYVFHDITSH